MLIEQIQTPSALEGDLTAFLHPVEEEEFFSRYWNRRALYIPGTPEKFAGLFDRPAFDQAVHTCGDLKVGFTDEKGWPGHFNIKPEQIPEMLASGKTVCASIVNPGNPVLTRFLRGIGERFAVAGGFFFNSYLSPDRAGFGLHLDHHPVSIMQIEGRKRWWYSRAPGLKDVVTNVSFPRDRDTLKLPWVTVSRPRPEDLCEVILNPGDILYMPKGTWHQAEAIGSSLGLTLAMESVVPLELIQAALLPHLNDIALRSQAPGVRAASVQDGMPAELEEVFDQALGKLRAVLRSLTVDDLYGIWCKVREARRQS